MVAAAEHFVRQGTAAVADIRAVVVEEATVGEVSVLLGVAMAH